MRSDSNGLYLSSMETCDKRPAYGHFIGGEWRAGRGEKILARSPASGEALAWIAGGEAQDIDAAVAAACAARQGAWGQKTAAQRGELMLKFAHLVLQHQDRLAWIEAHDTGKPITQARADIKAVARYFDFYGGAADKFHGEVIPYLNDYSVTLVREPLGVTAHITPWNYPAQMFGRTLAPALAMGNAVVLKPAEEACLVTLELAQLAHEAGFPAGSLNIVTGYGELAGAALTRHPDINFVSFTGSPEVGRLVQESAAIHHIPVVLELGGKSPQIVFEDADLAKAAHAVCRAIVQNTGQTCSAGSRVIVQKSVWERFKPLLVQQFSTLRMGLPEADTDLGPVINATQQQKVLGHIAKAIEQGCPVVTQVRVPAGLESGYFVPPTVFGPLAPDQPLVCEEVFGPVLAVQLFETEAQAIELANGTQYGLVAGVWTQNGSRQHRVAQRIVSGQVFINCYGAGGGVELPFGGTKRSGHGREKGLMALEEMSTTKTVVNYYGQA
jgi:aldehyde dehydrogenase (NAD+)